MEGREPVPRSVDEDTAIDEVVRQVFGVWRRSGGSGSPFQEASTRTPQSMRSSSSEYDRHRLREQRLQEQRLREKLFLTVCLRSWLRRCSSFQSSSTPATLRSSPHEHPWNRMEERLEFMERRSMHSSMLECDYERLRRQAAEEHSSDPEEQPEQQQ